MKPPIISVFVPFAPDAPAFLSPLGAPNPRFSGNGVQERNLIFRIILANPDTVPYAATGQFVAKFGGLPPSVLDLRAETDAIRVLRQAEVKWDKAVSIQAGGAAVVQGKAPGIDGGIAVLNALGVPDGPVDMDICWVVDGAIVSRCICPLIIKGQDLYSGGAEHPPVGAGPTGTDDAAKAELVTKEARKVVLETGIKTSTDEIAVIAPRILKLKGLLG